MPAKKTPRKTRLTVGDRVTFTLGVTQFPAVIVEDRGAIGYQGRRMLRIRPLDEELTSEPGNTFDWPAEELTFVSGRAQTPARTA